jgi:hypothetical protein
MRIIPLNPNNSGSPSVFRYYLPRLDEMPLVQNLIPLAQDVNRALAWLQEKVFGQQMNCS